MSLQTPSSGSETAREIEDHETRITLTARRGEQAAQRRCEAMIYEVASDIDSMLVELGATRSS